MPSRSAAVVTGFLRDELSGGAMSVAELEGKARAAGLLGERQQIQHAKAFQKVKKALGIQSIRNGFGSGGKWAWSMPPQAALLSHLLRYAQRNQKNHHALPLFSVARASGQNNSVEPTIGYIMSL